MVRMGDGEINPTLCEYVRDRIRQDTQDWKTVHELAQGLQEARNGEFIEEDILDILDESIS